MSKWQPPKITFTPANPQVYESLFTGFGLGGAQDMPNAMVKAVIEITDTRDRIQLLEQTLKFGGYEYGITYPDNR